MPSAAKALPNSNGHASPTRARYRSAVMLKRLRLIDFKAFSDATVELQPFTMIVGPNGSGKTSVLQAIELATGLVTGSISDMLETRSWEYGELSHQRSAGKQFGFELQLVDGDVVYEWNLRLGARRSPGVALESVTADGEELMRRKSRTMSRVETATSEVESVVQTLTQSWLSAVTAEDQTRYPELLCVANWARSVERYVALQPERLRDQSRRTSHGIGRYGENLAGFLGYLKTKQPAALEAVLERVKRVYPRLIDVHIKSPRAGWCRIEVTEKWGDKVLNFNARQVSDGLLRLLAVASIQATATPPSLVMFDEIENGLHPHLLGSLVTLLRDVAAAGIQVITTTHSPIALNHAAPDEVVVVTRDAVTSVANLVAFDETLGYLKLGSVLEPGELWYNLGEAKLLGSAAKS